MRVMVLVKADASSEAGRLPSPELLSAMMAYNEQLVAAGIMVAGEGLKPSSQGVRVHFAGDRRTVIDGPFAETKEVVAGFWLWEVASLDEAIEWVKRCPNPQVGESDVEIRPIVTMADFAEVSTPAIDAQEQRLRREIASPKITITAMKWAPPFAAGMVRDHRARWILNEVGWPYAVKLVDTPTMKSADYLRKQPFGQVPYLEEAGRAPLHESGAIVIDVATRAGVLIPTDEVARSQVTAWVVSALNSIEPFLMNVAEVEYFTEDRAQQATRRPVVVEMANERLGQLQQVLKGRRWLVGDEFTIADLMMGSVLRIAERLKLLEAFPELAAYTQRCLDRPAFRKAVADQCATIGAHDSGDMRYDEVG